MRPHPAQRLRAPTALPPSGPEIVPALEPGACIGPWRVGDALGARVHAALDAGTGEAVVLKAAAPDALAAEVAALGALRHPHLVGFAGTEVGVLATRRVPGPSLAGLLGERGRMSWRVAAAMLAPVADALAAIHAAGWVHGDVSAANVVVGPDATGVLVDLGRARRADAPGVAAGTPGSVAPEVEAGQAGGAAADVFSLAAVVVEAVTGAPPTPTTALPPGVALALRRALSSDPSARPTAAELAAALHAGSGTPQPFSSVSVSESATLTLDNGGRVATRVTQDYGPRPPVAVLEPDAPLRLRGPLALAVATVVAVVAIGALTVGRPGAAAPTETATPPMCAPVGSGPLVGDPDGDGCVVAATWRAGVLTVVVEPGTPARRYALGAPGDVVALEDWDCDGDDTPGLYRPATGVVTLYDTWPGTGPGAAPSLVTTGEGLPHPDC